MPWYKLGQSNSKRAESIYNGSESRMPFSASFSFFFFSLPFTAAAYTTEDAEGMPSTSVSESSLPGPGGGGRSAPRLRRPGSGSGAARPPVCAAGGHRRARFPASPRSGRRHRRARLPGELLPPRSELGGHPPWSCSSPSPFHASFTGVRWCLPAPGCVCQIPSKSQCFSEPREFFLAQVG